MKLFLKILLSTAPIFSTLPTYGSIFEAKPVSELVQMINDTSFTHKEDGLVFGFFSIQSCLYVSGEIVILKNYCVPAKDYPAKGYTIISPKFGIIDLYQEELGSVLKRDILISTFPDILKDYIKAPLNDSSINELNEIIEKLYYKNEPACWSTNASFATGQPVVQCSIEQVLNFDLWATETQNLTGDLAAWKKLIESIEASLQ